MTCVSECDDIVVVVVVEKIYNTQDVLLLLLLLLLTLEQCMCVCSSVPELILAVKELDVSIRHCVEVMSWI